VIFAVALTKYVFEVIAVRVWHSPVVKFLNIGAGHIKQLC